MIEFQLTKFSKARVWTAELPPVKFQPTNIISKTLPSDAIPFKNNRYAGIEIFIPIGARIKYALLAGKFIPKNSSNLLIEIPITDSDGDLVTWALASRLDRVRAGLIKEFVDGVWDGMNNAANLLGTGTLTLGPAAYGEIGSSFQIFKQTAQALISILSMESHLLSNDIIAQTLLRIFDLSK
jgi:hypothetical protein